jgi:hypothetical protein
VKFASPNTKHATFSSPVVIYTPTFVSTINKKEVSENPKE